eukprot:6190204-Pleurochrysis_carterae.AAC.1
MTRLRRRGMSGVRFAARARASGAATMRGWARQTRSRVARRSFERGIERRRGVEACWRCFLPFEWKQLVRVWMSA